MLIMSMDRYGLVSKLLILLSLSLFCSSLMAVQMLPAVVFKPVEIAEQSDRVIEQLVKEGANQINTDPVRARELFIEALQKVNHGIDIDEYHYLWTQYGLLKSSFLPNTSVYGPGTQEDYVKVAKQVLNFLDESTRTAIWYFTDIGQFQMEVYRVAGNGLSWILLTEGKTEQEWKEALAFITKAESYIRDSEDYYILDTKVRILLKLDRIDEGFEIVREVLKEAPDFEDFQDIKQDQDYLTWLKNH
jgi:tetratricopeptide (TPR) repeat protein